VPVRRGKRCGIPKMTPCDLGRIFGWITLVDDGAKSHNLTPMHVPCTKCQKPADLQETKPDRSRLFKCRDKKCREQFTLPPLPPPTQTWR
jgi:hypothetical protein